MKKVSLNHLVFMSRHNILFVQHALKFIHLNFNKNKGGLSEGLVKSYSATFHGLLHIFGSGVFHIKDYVFMY